MGWGPGTPVACLYPESRQVTPLPWSKDDYNILNRGSKSNCKVNNFKHNIRNNDLIHKLFMLALFGMPRP